MTPEGLDELHRRLARALTSLGEVCFRSAGTEPLGARQFGMVKASRLPWRRAWSVIGSRDSMAVLALERLTDVRLMEDELLVLATVDGAALLLCAASAARLETAIEALRQCFLKVTRHACLVQPRCCMMTLVA